jgi:hypothetical protein
VTRAEAVASSQQQPNRIVQFDKPNHLVSPRSMQRGVLKTITPRIAPSPHWCPPGLTPSQRRRIQGLGAQKLREEVAEKEREGDVEGEGEGQHPCNHGL